MAPAAAQDIASLRFEPFILELAPGERARVEILAERLPASGLAALQVDLSFTEELVAVENPNEAYRGIARPYTPLGADPGLCETVRGVSPCPDPSWLLTATGRSALGTDALQPDRALAAYGTHGASLPPSSDGVVALVDVVGSEFGSSLVRLGDSVLGDSSEPPVAHPFVGQSLIVITGTGHPDLDADGIPDAVDNCTTESNGTAITDLGGNVQLDGDGDGIGNLCDADLNNDNTVDFLDAGILKAAFFSDDRVADLNGDGVVDFLDLGRMKDLFFQPPGPSGRTP